MKSLNTPADPTTPIAQIAKTMREHDIEAVPVQQGGRIVGMVTERDIVNCVAGDGGDLSRATAQQALSARDLCDGGGSPPSSGTGGVLPMETFVREYLALNG